MLISADRRPTNGHAYYRVVSVVCRQSGCRL